MDEILSIEDNLTQRGFEEGYNEGEKVGREEGEEHGYLQGLSIGKKFGEIYFYVLNLQYGPNIKTSIANKSSTSVLVKTMRNTKFASDDTFCNQFESILIKYRILVKQTCLSTVSRSNTLPLW
jgi:hypothetical protein